MYKKLLTFTFIILFQLLYAQNLETIPKRFSEGEIKVDGIISQKEWDDFTPIEDFIEFQPEEGKVPPVKTDVFVGYDEKNLYLAFKCYDNIESIRKTLTPRDQIGMDDIVLFYLWTYSKGGEGYMFGTNPLSVQYDGIKGAPPSNEEDWSFDTQWDVKSFVGDSFWSVEFQIPFSSLRFKEKDEQNWRILFVRIRPRASTEMYSLPKISQDNPSIFDQSVILIIPERISSCLKRLSLIPYLIGSQNGWEEAEEYNLDRGKFNVGVSGNYQIATNLTLDFAINPDYSNIETDIPQIDVNTTCALYYPEKRPFFMEGSNIIETPIDIFYTRMVNNPLYAMKLTGKVSNFDLYLLSAYDENTAYIVSLEDFSFNFSSDKKSFINFLRIRDNFLNSESYIGLTLGDREVKKDSLDNGYGRILGFDTKIRFLKHYTFTYQGVYSDTKEPEDTSLFSGYGINFDKYTDKFDGEKFNGFAHRLKFSSNFRNLNLSLYYMDLSPTFRSDIGYIERNNLREGGIHITPLIYPNKYNLEKISIGLNYDREYNYEGKLKNESVNIFPKFSLSFAQTQLGLNIGFERERFFDVYFPDLHHIDIFCITNPYKWLNIFLWGGTAKTIYYDALIPAYSLYYSPSIGIFFTKFRISIGINREILYREKYRDLISEATVLSLYTDYSLSNTLSFRLTSFYYTAYKSIGFSPLFTYQLTAFTSFYLGANINTLKEDEPFGIKGQDHQIFLKFQYLFKI